METFLKTCFLTLVIAFTLLPKVMDADIAPSMPVKRAVVAQVKTLTPEMRVRASIVKQAQVFAIPAKPILMIADCESQFNEHAWNKSDPNGGSKGILQFQTQTFFSYAKKLKIENPDIWNVDQQATVAAYMIKNGQIGQWSCAHSLGLVK